MASTSVSHNHNNNKSTPQSIYVEYEVPDTRKRFTVSFIKDDKVHETLCVVIPNKFTWSGFIHLLLTKFKLEPNLKNKIRVKTNDGRRINDLTNTYNNQLIQFSLSNLYEEEQEDIQLDAQGLPSLKSSFNNSTTDKDSVKRLPFLEPGQNVESQFIKDAIKLLSTYKDHVIIGESYPYKVKVLLPLGGNSSLYFVEQPYPEEGEQENGNYKFNTIIHCNDIETFTKIKSVIDLKTDKDSIVSLASKVVNLSPKKKSNEYKGSVSEPTRSLFPNDFKVHFNISPNDFLSDHYSLTNLMSKKFDLPFSLARDFLFQVKWLFKKTRGFEKANFDEKYPTHTKRDVSQYNFNSLNLNLQDGDDVFDCPICYCDCGIQDTTELLCGHRFCNDCLQSYFISSIEDGNGAAVSIACPSVGCSNKFVDEVTIETLLPAKNITRLQENYVNDLMFFTRSKKCTCGYIYKKPYDTSCFIPFYECKCGANICLDCGEEDIHWPLSCKDARTDEDLQSYDWIAKNTTICPSCQFPVEKWTGCNHMTCSRCRHEFCYLCGNDYRGHMQCPPGRTTTYKYQKFFKALRGREMNPDVIQSFIEQDTKPAISQALKSIHNNMIFLSMRRKNATKTFIMSFEALFMTLSEYAYSKGGSITQDSITFLQRCTRKFMRETRKPPSFYQVLIDNSPVVKSLSANICLNGSASVVVSNVFVNTQFSEFKNEIVSALKKKNIEGYDVKNIRILNRYGGQIRSSLEIFDKEKLYIIKDSEEKFIAPFDDDSDEENESDQGELVTVTFGEMTKTFNELKQKKHAKLDNHLKKLEKTLKEKEAFKDHFKQLLLAPSTIAQDVVVDNKVDGDDTATTAADTTATTDDDGDEEILLSQFIKEFVKINKSDSDTATSESDSGNGSSSITDKEEQNLKITERILEIFKFENLEYDYVYQIVSISPDLNSACDIIYSELPPDEINSDDDHDEFYDTIEDRISGSVKRCGKSFYNQW
ncbi:hypothetical protein CYY_007281 [Polysphondylium violaceum]|uniref:RBR-type E3 ubiquitin transferase n=1 Tax=Polysphondylium violaceum TaxID=133409 RepID=A0A8J4V2D0_9MYCE|nr:hypothetical protein CYY_007281 [Polysphondylium violaceum]